MPWPHTWLQWFAPEMDWALTLRAKVSPPSWHCLIRYFIRARRKITTPLAFLGKTRLSCSTYRTTTSLTPKPYSHSREGGRRGEKRGQGAQGRKFYQKAFKRPSPGIYKKDYRSQSSDTYLTRTSNWDKQDSLGPWDPTLVLVMCTQYFLF